MKGNLWTLGVAFAVIGGMFLYHRFRFSKDGSLLRFWEGTSGKNFGAFPPDVPENLFDEVNFI